MANFSELTRKEQVLEYLKARLGSWVDTTEIANEVVGGSEGTKRLRELKAEGWMIQMRSHPDKGVDQYQYRLAAQDRVLDEPTPRPYSEAPPPPTSDRPMPPPPPQSYRQVGEAPSRGRQEPKWGHWELKNPITHEYAIVYWIAKQRLIGTIVPDPSGDRWFWGLKLPAYNPKKGLPRKEHKWSGSVRVGGDEGRQAAKDAVHHQLEKLREEGLPND